MIGQAEILGLEERALNAWPALETVGINGWALRFSGGFTKRANSVNAIQPVGSFAEVRLAAQNLYDQQNLPAIFRISPLAPPEADHELAGEGYQFHDPSHFMTAELVDGTLSSQAEVADHPSDEWLAGFARANNVPPSLHASHNAIVRSIALPAAFVTIRNDKLPIAYGLGVIERGMVGLFDIVVVPAARGQGVGRLVTQTIMAWGHQNGARRAYLNVRQQNDVALRLYASLGFVKVYDYHYRIPPA